MNINTFNGLFLLATIFLLTACGSGSGSDSEGESVPDVDMRGDWIVSVHGSPFPVTITSHNRKTGEFKGESDGEDGGESYNLYGNIEWSVPPNDGPGLVVVWMRIYIGEPVFCPFATGSRLGINYAETEAFYIYAAEEVYSLALDNYAPRTAYRDAEARHRYRCSEIGSGASVGHEAAVTLVRSRFPDGGIYKIGTPGPAGGIIFYIADDSLHGLEVASKDQSVTAKWGCSGAPVDGADGTAIGTGAQNTADMLSGCMDTPIAADIAAGYTLNGYSDWYLPSKDELNELFLSREAVGGFTHDYYWSSSEFDVDSAWSQHFNVDYRLQTRPDKDVNMGVRAVRAF